MRPSRLIVVDDEPEIGRLIQSVADGLGYEIRMAHDVATFQECLASFPADVIVLDLIIPDCDGIELLRMLADAGSRARILLMSGYDAKLLEAARRLGEAWGLTMAGAVMKPFRIAEMQAVLKRMRDPA